MVDALDPRFHEISDFRHRSIIGIVPINLYATSGFNEFIPTTGRNRINGYRTK
jgi:hypothetical protein